MNAKNSLATYNKQCKNDCIFVNFILSISKIKIQDKSVTAKSNKLLHTRLLMPEKAIFEQNVCKKHVFLEKS